VPTVYPLNYSPNLDTNWSVNPGACTDMSYLLQMQDGSLQGVRVDNSTLGFSLTGSDHLHAEVFMQTGGSARFLTFRKQNIDEYSNTGTRTNRGTGYNASTTDWSATAWGNQIIACNYLDATQSSTGAGFSGLGGGSPKARYVASNINFVMFADVDDGGSNVNSDMVWWSGIRNPNTYTPSQATQAGAIRLLDVPGPIKGIVSFQDKFVVFKGNAVIVGQYIGPPHVFSWRVAAYGVGLSYPKAITECDGKLFFCHLSGVYSFDGASLQNIGLPIWSPVETFSTADTIRMRGDDVQGNVFLGVHNQVQSSFTQNELYTYAYNCRSGLWARQGLICVSDPNANNPEQPIVYGSTAEYRAFSPTWGAASGFAWIDNAASAKLSFLTGGNAVMDNAASLTTGRVGANDSAGKTTRVYLRLTGATSSNSNLVSSATLSGYHREIGSADTTASLGFNTITDTLDGTVAGRYKSVSLTFSTSRIVRLPGLGFDNFPAGRV